MSRLAWGLVLAVALAATAAAVPFALRLGIVFRLEDMLPEDAPAAADYRTFLDTFGGFEKVYALILWQGDGEPDRALLAEAADLLAQRLAARPQVAGVRSGLAPEDEAFLREQVLPRAPLFLGDDAEVAARLDPDAARRRVREIRERLRSPGGNVEARWLAADPLGFSGGLEGLAEGSLDMVDPITGAFLAPGGDAALVIVTPATGELDVEAGRALAAGLEKAFAATREELGAPLALAAVGGPLYAVQDEEILRADLTRTITGSATAVLLLLVLYFAGVGLPAAILAAVAAGLLWTVAATSLVHGEVSALGLSFAAMLLGLGVDYGIHGASRFREARLAGLAAPAAVRRALGETGPAILASACTTAAAFLVLIGARFRPVEELGVVMTAGILAVLLATVTVGAPLLALRRAAPGVPLAGRRRLGPLWPLLGRLNRGAVGFGERHAGVTLAAAGLLSAAALFGLTRLEISIDPRSMRPEDHPAFAAEERLGEMFGVGLDTSTLVVNGDDLDQALDRARAVEAAVRRHAGDDVRVASPAGWLPRGEGLEARWAAVAGEPARRAAAALEEEIAAQGFDPRPFAPALAVLRAAGRGERPPPIAESAWPDWVREQVRTGEAGPDARAAVAVRVTTPLGTWPSGPPPELLAAVAEAAPGTAVASVPRLGSELQSLLMADLRRLGAWSLAGVAVLSLLSFLGRPRPVASAVLGLVPVTCGVLWTVGLAGLAGVPLDGFTIVVAPLLLGIGIDDGLHALHGARVHGGLAPSLLENGRAMALTTLTTCAGFGSLALSRVPALRHGGLLVAGGTVLCLAATLVVLPALGRALALGAVRREEDPA